jgi:uncharacterized oxidoreductase
MELEKRTILITGGTSGIGFELAKQLLERGNTVIVTGRDQGKLDTANQVLRGVHTFRSDVSDPGEIAALHDRVLSQFPSLDTLINNAGIMRNLNLTQDRGLDDVTREIEINLSGPVRMIQQFLPHLKTRNGALIVNVSSGLHPVPLVARLLRHEGGDSLIHAIPARAARRHGRYGDRAGPARCRDAAAER